MSDGKVKRVYNHIGKVKRAYVEKWKMFNNDAFLKRITKQLFSPLRAKPKIYNKRGFKKAFPLYIRHLVLLFQLKLKTYSFLHVSHSRFPSQHEEKRYVTKCIRKDFEKDIYIKCMSNSFPMEKSKTQNTKR